MDALSEGPRICSSSVMLLSPLQLPQPGMLAEDVTLPRCQVLSRPRSVIFHKTMELTLRHRDVCHLTLGGPMDPWMPELELFWAIWTLYRSIDYDAVVGQHFLDKLWCQQQRHIDIDVVHIDYYYYYYYYYFFLLPLVLGSQERRN